MARFLEATGIRPEDWLGRYWARWGDAVREAGFEPNTLTAPLDEDLILERLAVTIRKLGRLPTRTELMLEKRSDSSFPSHTVFTRRLGSTQQQIATKMLEYCGERPELADVLDICAERLLNSIGKPAPAETGATPGIPDGAVYLFKSGRFYKIGRTNATGRRERELALLMPEKGNVVHSIATDDPAGIEAYWHERFAAKRKGGEWFDLDAGDVVAFKRRKFM